MIARCARCQGTFTTDRFGAQSCPHCGTTLDLADPGAAAAQPPPPPAGGQWAGPATPPAPGAPPAAGAVPPLPGAPPPHALPPGGPPPAGSWGPPPGWTPPPPSIQELPAPFAERSTRGFFPSLVETAKLVATQPADFFRRVRVDQAGSAVLFGVLLASLGTIAGAVYGWLGSSASLSAMEEMAAGLPEPQARIFRGLGGMMSGAFTVGQLVTAPLFALIGIYLSAALLHLVLLVLRATPRRFDATLTTVGYAYGLFGLGVLPLCGGPVALVWYLAVVIIGLGEAQRCGAGKAAVAVFAPVLLACVCCCGAVGLGGAGAVQALKELADTAKDQGTSL